MRQPIRVRPLLYGGVLALILLTACDVSALPEVSTSVPAQPPARIMDAAGARAALHQLPVRPAGSMSGYDRSCSDGHHCVFGAAWKDVDHNGCDTRNDILRRDLTGESFRSGTHECVVVAGTLNDPYTGTTIRFTKAEASEVQIDHVVALADAWRSGAAAWPVARREQLANDPTNLHAVDGGTNSGKGDQGPAEWRPPNRAYWCGYARTYVTVKVRYRLTVSPEDARALAGLLAGCR